MKLKNLFRRAKKEDRPEKTAKTKTAAAEMILDDEVLQMLSGGVQRDKVWSMYAGGERVSYTNAVSRITGVHLGSHD